MKCFLPITPYTRIHGSTTLRGVYLIQAIQLTWLRFQTVQNALITYCFNPCVIDRLLSEATTIFSAFQALP